MSLSVMSQGQQRVINSEKKLLLTAHLNGGFQIQKVAWADVIRKKQKNQWLTDRKPQSYNYKYKQIIVLCSFSPWQTTFHYNNTYTAIKAGKSWSRDKLSQLHDNSIVIIYTWQRLALYRTTPPLSEWNSSFCREVFTFPGVGLASKSCMRGWKENRSCAALLHQSISPAVLLHCSDEQFGLQRIPSRKGFAN